MTKNQKWSIITTNYFKLLEHAQMCFLIHHACVSYFLSSDLVHKNFVGVKIIIT